MAPPGEAYRAIYPLSPTHERIFQALGSLRQAEKKPLLQLWQVNRWQRQSLWDVPPAGQVADSVALRVRMMQAERRGDTVNLANHSGKPIAARLWLEGLPSGATPPYASLRQVEYVAMTSGIWDANALPETAVENGAWTVTLPAGISRQFWLAFHPGADVKPGDYRGALVVEAAANRQVRVPARLTIEPFRYPAEHTLSFYMWDYTPVGEGSSYGLTSRNAAAARATCSRTGSICLSGAPSPRSRRRDSTRRMRWCSSRTSLPSTSGSHCGRRRATMRCTCMSTSGATSTPGRSSGRSSSTVAWGRP